ncbi:FAD-binding oxidoreductase [Rhodobacteraceae bacterium M382]|nr:FAD-binding oxidoreductase [Rhodobacteraceae bacterium M382]
MMDVNSLWRVTAPKPPIGLGASGDLCCDVLVVGGGFTGLRAALELAEAGTDVIVLEAETLGYGASGRSGGQVNPMLPVTYPADLRRAVGDVYFDRMADVSLRSADDLFDLVRKYQIACDARQNGWVRCNHCDKARTAWEKAARLWNAFGAGFEFLGQTDVQRLTGASGYGSAVLSPKGGAVQPLSLVYGLAAAAVAAGARIIEGARASQPRREGADWVLNIDQGQVRAQSIIVATNGYTDDLIPGLKRSILPLTPVQIATEPLSDDQIGPILAQGHTISDTRRLIMYARRETGNQMVFGGIGFRKPFGGTGGFRWLLQDAPRIFPSLKGVKWTYRWGGEIALTSDHVPHLHEPEPGIFAGLGYNGRGVAMSLVMGKVLAQRALGAGAESLPFPVTGMRNYRFRDIQVRGAGLAMGLMRVRDKLEAD